MPVYPDKAKGRWRFEFTRIIHGRRIRSTKLLPKGWNRGQAEKYDRDETARIYAVASGVEQPEPAISDAVALYVEHRLPKLRDGHHTGRELSKLIEYIDGRPISELADVAREYDRDNPDLAPATVRNRLAYLKAACRYAWKKHRLTKLDPTGQMEMPVVSNQREVHTTVKRVVQLLNAIDDREARAVFVLAFRLGSRWVKGILPRQSSDIERVGRDVWLRVGITKNGTPRMKWVHPDARWALAYLPFKHSETYYSDRFRAAAAKVGLKGLWAHDMRHVIGTDIRRRGGSLGDVGAALDHDSYASSQRYAHITSPHVKAVLAKVGGGRTRPKNAA